jgi:transposase-like protein/transposase InsO family protein
MARKTYTEQERREILADAPTLGVKTTAREHGVPPTTVQSWIDRGKANGTAAAPARRTPTAVMAEPATVSEGTSANGPGTPRSGRRRYSEERKRQVAADAVKRGVCAAAREHGVAESNVSRWRDRYGASSEDSARVEPEDRASGADERAEVETPRARRKHVAKTYTPSQKAEAIEYAAAHGVSAASAALGMSRHSIYQWQHQVEKAAAGQGESPTSGPDPADIEAQRDAEIRAEYKRHPGLGPSQIKNQLRRKGVKVSVQTTRRVMEEAGYRPPKVKREPHDERFEAVRPNHLWHLDFVHRHINRSSTFNLILIDDYSRFVVGHGTDEAERGSLVIETFEQAVTRYGRPEMVIHDKGSAFWSWRGISKFTALLTELGIDQIEAQHKEWNGKLEVFNANLHKELYDVQRFYDVAEMKRRLAAHLWWYNHERTSHALGGLLVPADRYYGRVDEVLARIEAGAGRDGLDALDLSRRALDLFKVVTSGGVPEVWLMGTKLLPARA